MVRTNPMFEYWARPETQSKPGIPGIRNSTSEAGSIKAVSGCEPRRGQVWADTGKTQYHPSQEKLRVKRTRHRRNGSQGSSSLTPRDSPNRDRRSASHGEEPPGRVLAGLCEVHTQTELPPTFPYSNCSEIQVSANELEISPRGGLSCLGVVDTPLVTPRYSGSSTSLNGNTVGCGPLPGVTPPTYCNCPGCPGNITNYSPLCFEMDRENRNLVQEEDYLDTLDRKVNEIMNRDCSRRSSHHDLGKVKDNETGNTANNRMRGVSDLNCNSSVSPYSPRFVPAPEGVIRFEEDGKASSEEPAMDSSREDLSLAWSEDDSDYVLRRRSVGRRPVRGKNRHSVMSVMSACMVTSGEEGEASEYPGSSSQRSTLEGRRDEGLQIQCLEGQSSEDEDISQDTVTTSRDTRHVGGP